VEVNRMSLADRVLVVGWGAMVLGAIVMLTLNGAPTVVVLSLIACLPRSASTLPPGTRRWRPNIIQKFTEPEARGPEQAPPAP